MWHRLPADGTSAQADAKFPAQSEIRTTGLKPAKSARRLPAWLLQSFLRQIPGGLLPALWQVGDGPRFQFLEYLIRAATCHSEITEPRAKKQRRQDQTPFGVRHTNLRI